MNQLRDLIQLLVKEGVDFVLVGGYAAVVHGVSFVTRDVDVCLAFSPESLLRLQSALAPIHPRHRLTPDRIPLLLSNKDCQGLKNLYLETDLGVLDCLGEVLGVGAFPEVKARSQEMDFPFGRCRVLDLSALIDAKEAMGRPHDRLTVVQLKAIQEARNQGRSR